MPPYPDTTSAGEHPLRFMVGDATIELVRGDITQQQLDAIVNAANVALARGGGVCGAIFQAAGPAELATACAAQAPCPTGAARITPGFRLAARYIIHAVGPVYGDYAAEEAARLLAAAYRSSLELALQHNLTSIALPSIATGIYGYPPGEAAGVALAAVRDMLVAPGSLRLVRFVLFDEQTFAAYARAAQALGLGDVSSAPAGRNAATAAPEQGPHGAASLRAGVKVEGELSGELKIDYAAGGDIHIYHYPAPQPSPPRPISEAQQLYSTDYDVQINDLEQAAEALVQNRQLEEAIERLYEALRIAAGRKSETLLQQARLLRKIGDLYTDTSSVELALERYQEGLQLIGERPSSNELRRERIALHTARAKLYLDYYPEHELASAEIRRAELLANELGVEDELLAEILLVSAVVSYEQRQSGRSITQLKKAQALFQRAGDRHGKFRAQGNLAIIYLRRGDAQGAVATFEKMLRDPQRPADADWLHRAYLNYALALIDGGDLDGAAHSAGVSRTHAQQRGDAAGELLACAGLAGVARERVALARTDSARNKAAAAVQQVAHQAEGLVSRIGSDATMTSQIQNTLFDIRRIVVDAYILSQEYVKATELFSDLQPALNEPWLESFTKARASMSAARLVAEYRHDYGAALAFLEAAQELIEESGELRDLVPLHLLQAEYAHRDGRQALKQAALSQINTLINKGIGVKDQARAQALFESL